MLYDPFASHAPLDDQPFNGGPGSRGYSHLLVPTGLTRRENAAISLAVEMAMALGAKLTLLHVVPEPFLERDRTEPFDSWHWLEAIDRLHSALQPAAAQRAATLHAHRSCIAEARQKLERAFEQLTPPRLRSLVDTRLECRAGEVVDEVVRFAAQEEVDLVILTSALSWWRLPVIPKRLHRLLRQMHKRLIVVRPEVETKLDEEPSRR